MKRSTSPKLAYTMQEAAGATGLSYWTIRRECNAGKLDCSLIRGRVLILADSLKAFLEQGRKSFVSSK